MRCILLSLLCLALPATGCAQPTDTNDANAVIFPSHIQGALQNSNRPRSDTKRDAARKSGDILTASGLTPGMQVLEIEAGKGYFTEILSYAVGPTGHVFVQNPAKLNSFFGKDLEERIARRPLENVTVSADDFDKLAPATGSVDLVTWVQGPHEVWFQPSRKVSLGDPQTAFNEISRVLKSGGQFIAVDHIAPPGSGPAAGNTLHRADADLVRQTAERAGLVFTKSHDFLLRPSDNPARPSYDGAVRGKTSQFVYVFTKP